PAGAVSVLEDRDEESRDQNAFGGTPTWRSIEARPIRESRIRLPACATVRNSVRQVGLRLPYSTAFRPLTQEIVSTSDLAPVRICQRFQDADGIGEDASASPFSACCYAPQRSSSRTSGQRGTSLARLLCFALRAHNPRGIRVAAVALAGRAEQYVWNEQGREHSKPIARVRRVCQFPEERTAHSRRMA